MRTSVPFHGMAIVGFALAFCFLSGCVCVDGFFEYRYQGRIFLTDKTTPLAGVPVYVLMHPVKQEDLDQYEDQHYEGHVATTDDKGNVEGRIYTGLSWGYTMPFIFVPLMRAPVPPALKGVYVYVRWRGSWEEIVVALDQASQKPASSGVRHLDLGIVRVPQLPP